MAVFKDTWKLDIDQAVIGQIRKLNKRVVKLEKSFEKTSKGAAKTNKALVKTGKAVKQVGQSGEATSKTIEGLAAGLGVSAISGERLTNVWLAAGAAVGGLAIGIAALVGKGLQAYIKTNDDAKDATDRLTLAQERFFVSIGKATFAAEDGERATDSFAGALDRLTGKVEQNATKIRGFLEGVVFVAAGLVRTLVTTTAAGLTPVLGVIDLIKAGVGNLADNFLALVRVSALGAQAVGLLTKEETANVQKNAAALQQDIRNLTDLENGLVAKLWEGRDAISAFTEEMAFTAVGATDTSGAFQLMDKSVQGSAKALKSAGGVAAKTGKSLAKLREEAKRLSDLQLKEILNFEPVVADAKRLLDLLDDIEKGLTKTGGLAGKAKGLIPKVGAAAGSIDVEETEAERAARIQKEKAAQFKASVNSAFEGLQSGGILLATEQLTTFIETMAAGTFVAEDFGRGILLSVGNWIGDFGEAMVTAGTMALLVESGGLISSPAAAIGLGLAAVALGKAMSGFSQRGTRDSGGSGGGRADRSARQTARALTDRRSEREDREDAPIIVVMDRKVVGRAMRDDSAQASRRGEFNSRGVRS